MLAIDHVIFAVPDLEVAAERLEVEHGLASRAGGRHPGHGTGNRIVPLGEGYLELMTVVDPGEAAGSRLGRAVRRQLARGPGLLALCLRTDGIDEVARRLREQPLAMTRTRPDGRVLAWRLAGLESALGAQRLPFFIQWDGPDDGHPGREAVGHRVEVRGLRGVGMGGDSAALMARMGEPVAGVEAVGGHPGPRWVEIATAAGVVRLGHGPGAGQDPSSASPRFPG